MNSNILPKGADRDFTASVYILKERKVLLLKHKKSGMWLQPGGHIERNEMPYETALREVKEETGFEVTLIDLGDKNEYEEEAEDLPNPFKVNAHKIREGHWHCDFAFLAEVEGKKEASHSHEHEGIKWFSSEELKNEEFEMPENVRKAALEAIGMFIDSKENKK